MAQKNNVQRARALSTMVAASLGLHVAGLLGLFALGAFARSIVPKPQAVMTARLVRRGPPRDAMLLPTLSNAAKAPQVQKTTTAPAVPQTPKTSATSAPVSQAKSPSAQYPGTAAQAARTKAALQRLRSLAGGEKDGDIDGDADDAQGGDRYTALVERCMKANFVIEGTEPLLVANRLAQAQVRIASSGKVMDFRLVKSSGLQAFDNAVSRAVRSCAQVPPPPAERKEQLRRAGIVITFRP